jgi:protein-S-isoprenylcysteine O-methyltransferase Ste14
LIPPRFPKPYADFVARLRVPCGFALVAAFAWFSHPAARSLAVGLPVSLIGLALRAWAAGHLAKNQALATSGPYAYTRNPLYLGTLLVAAGLVIASRSVGLGLLFLAVFVLIYLPVIQLEEQHLRSLFPDYAAYAACVPALWPWRHSDRRTEVRPGALKRAARAFQWSLYVKNGEYQAALGFLAGALFLLWKVS